MSWLYEGWKVLALSSWSLWKGRVYGMGMRYINISLRIEPSRDQG